MTVAKIRSVNTIAVLQSEVAAGIATRFDISIDAGGCIIRLQSNSGALVDRLADYFAAFLATPGAAPDIEIRALQMPAPDLGLAYIDWPREAGKTGRKDSYVDFADGRACRKVKTGMQYLMGAGAMTVFGDCLANDNQVVNFVISQQIGWFLNRGWSLCHAAAVAMNGKGLAISAFSGAGKSTLALHLMNTGLDFVTNDRALIRRAAGTAEMLGVPKQPRINPGTILNNPALSGLIGGPRVAELGALSKDALWQLEDKYDAPVDRLYGAGRFQLDASLSALLILNWSHDATEAAQFTEIDIAGRPDLMAAVTKAPGPFYVPADADAPRGIAGVNPAVYLDVLEGVRVFEATGRADFDAGVGFCGTVLEG